MNDLTQNEYAHLKQDSPFYSIFEKGAAPIINVLIPSTGIMGNNKKPEEFYWLDVNKCSNEQIEQIAKLVAQLCGGTTTEVKTYMQQEGKLPIRASQVNTVSAGYKALALIL